MDFDYKKLSSINRVVVKVGTSSLTYDSGKINIRRFEALVRVLSDLKNQGKEVVLVSSAAIAVGMGKLGLGERPKEIKKKQALAALGQIELMSIYGKMFAEYGHMTAQILLTKDVMVSAERRENVQNAFRTLLDYGVIPIVNENDVVSIEEIEFGDNDTLSAYVTEVCGAELLVIFSDINGLYNKNPKEYPDAEIIPLVSEISDDILLLAGGAGSNRGTGGMITKLNAAKIATSAGAYMMILNGERPSDVYKAFEGKPIGTLFLPKDKQIG